MNDSLETDFVFGAVAGGSVIATFWSIPTLLCQYLSGKTILLDDWENYFVKLLLLQ